MIKILIYEIKRMILTKMYGALLLLTLAFSYYVLSNFTIMGTANTAPFSKWSYSDFLCSISPFLMVSMLFFCTYVFSKNEMQVRTITLSTPLTIIRYYLVKAAAIMLSYVITATLTIVLSFIFYAKVFNYFHYSNFIIPIALFLIPQAIFLFGFGMLLGTINNSLQYVLVILTFIMGNLDLSPLGLGSLFSKGFVENYPLMLSANKTGEVPFLLPSLFIESRILWIAFGILLFLVVLIMSNKHSAR